MPHIFYRPLMSGTVCVTLCFVLVFQLTPSVADAQADNPDQPYAIAARASVDENLFALRLLADIYAHWPDLKGDRSNLRKWFAGARTSTAEMQGRIRSRRLDPDLDSLFRDCLDYMAATETYLASLDLIEDQNSTKSIFDALTSAWDAYQTGSGAASTAGKMGFSDGHAASAGKLIGAADFAANLAARSRARNATTQLAISEQARKLSDRSRMDPTGLQQRVHRYSQFPNRSRLQPVSGARASIIQAIDDAVMDVEHQIWLCLG